MNPKVRLQLSVMMFLQFFAMGAWIVAMWRYLGALNFSDSQRGYSYSTTGWAAIISPFIVGMIADRFFATEKVLGVLHLVGGVILYYVSTVTEAALFIPLLFVYTLCYMPTMALANSISFDQMTDPAKEFPGIRVLGTAGWIAAGLLVGFMPASLTGMETIETTSIPMKIGAGTSILLGVFCFFLPHTPPKSAGEKVTVRDVLCLDALKLMREFSFSVFLIGSLLVCIPLAFYYQSGNGFVGEIGMTHAAGKMTLGQMSEVLFMLVMPFLLIRLGVKWMLLVGILAWTARYFLFAFGNNEELVWMLYGGIILHGVCFDFFFVTGQIYVDKKAPTNVRASAQGLLALITLGVGMVIGNLINGWVTGMYSYSQLVYADEAGAELAGKLVTNLGGQVVLDGSAAKVAAEVLEAVRTQYAASLAEELMTIVTLHHWREIWLIPAVMALVLAVLFALAFREKNDSAEANDAAAD